MPTTQQLRTRLANKLKELFQLDQPDLDFGFYRIMHAKAEQVTTFIENDLLKIVADAFGHLEVQNSQGLLTQAKQRVIDTLGEDAFDAEGNLVAAYRNSPIGKGYLAELAKIEQSKSALSAEADIYDHLYRFFERYYDNGDFISRRYYARETAGKAAPFGIPYNGEEVKLHWANADQYYIKTTEYFANFTFDLRQAKEVNDLRLPLSFGEDEQPRKVHFRIVDATEGEHGNVKAAESTKRFFLIYADNPVERTATGELVINFEYRPDQAKTGAEDKWREKRDAEAVEVVLGKVAELAQVDNAMAEYLHLLKIPVPTEKDSKRPLLAKYVNQYTARNTMDYFIHKDLGGFLRRELDFYIKNEVMRLDDIEHAEAPAVETYLLKIKVLRKIAGKLIDFLVQLEEFQKKLWLKKKFVVETNYCITLDRVPEELYPEIATNQAQHDEWVKFFAINEINRSTIATGYSMPLTVDFLKENNKLVLDTRLFSETFKEKLISSLENFEDQCDGLLVHSENLQLLNLFEPRYKQQLNCIYIDPPYNTGKDGFPYKDNYQHSSWLSMLLDRLTQSLNLINNNGGVFISIDENEHHNLRQITDGIFGLKNLLADFVWLTEGNFDNQAKIKIAHEYVLGYAIDEKKFLPPPVIDPSISESSKLYREEIRNTIVKNGPKNPVSSIEIPIGFPASFESGVIKAGSTTWPQYDKDIVVQNFQVQNIVKATSGWSSKALYETFIKNQMLPVADIKGQLTSFIITSTGAIESVKKRNDSQSYVTSLIRSVGTIQSTSTMLDNMNCSYPHYPKPVKLVSYLTSMIDSDQLFVIDYFAGSGTTAHAIINLDRDDKEEGRSRKYILVEVGDYFDTILKPRIAKVIYSQEWRDGKPTRRDTGISHCFKYLRLESYEDTLNNLRFDDSEAAKQRSVTVSKNPALKEDYMLHYLLDVEMRGSHSLLNVDAFADPTAYTLQVKKPGTDEYVEKTIDLLETFNYLIGLRVNHIAAPQTFTADFERLSDPELPHDQHTKLVVKGRIRQDADGPWWFRKVEGWVPQDPNNPNNGQQEKVLIVWRKLTGDQEKDNLMLDEWFQRNRISPRDFEFDTIYVNGSNNLPNLKQEEDNWKVRLLEEEFMQRMWDVEGM